MMSRHEYLGKEGRWKIVIGWDNGLETFFAQVWDASVGDERGAEDPIELWVGTLTGEVGTVEELGRIVEPYGPIPDEHLGHLREEFARRKPPTPFQRLHRR
jgi:hypothetical protein